MTSCKSSQIESHGYDPVTNTLAVKFHSGHTYHYAGVSAEKHAEMCKCESVGKFLGAHVKGKFEYVRTDNAKKN